MSEQGAFNPTWTWTWLWTSLDSHREPEAFVSSRQAETVEPRHAARTHTHTHTHQKARTWTRLCHTSTHFYIFIQSHFFSSQKQKQNYFTAVARTTEIITSYDMMWMATSFRQGQLVSVMLADHPGQWRDCLHILQVRVWETAWANQSKSSEYLICCPDKDIWGGGL